MIPQFIRKKTIKHWPPNPDLKTCLVLFWFDRFKGKWDMTAIKMTQAKIRTLMQKRALETQQRPWKDWEKKHRLTTSWCSPTWIQRFITYKYSSLVPKSSKHVYISRRFITPRLQGPKTKNCKIWPWKSWNLRPLPVCESVVLPGQEKNPWRIRWWG